MEEVPVFRPPKRRKFVKPQSSSEDEIDPTVSKEHVSSELGSAQLAEKPSRSVAQILKMRQQNRGRGAGVSYSNSRTTTTEGETDAKALTLMETANSSSDRLKAMSDRFVGHSHQVVDVDKHMCVNLKYTWMAYVDSEMAKRRAMAIPQPPLSRPETRPQTSGMSDLGASSSEEDTLLQRNISTYQAPATTRNPASLGQLQEIDLGPSAHERAISLTSAALAQQSNTLRTLADEPKRPLKPRKPRLGRDGKPLRQRPRKRRPSADIARDALVDQVLSENRLDLYDGIATAATANTSTDKSADTDADERLAAQFRQDFLDALASRQQTAQPPKAGAGGKAAAGDVGQKGPKLGGSRSARAAMVQAMREKEAGAKK